uniref:uncharacterized protein LOC120328833 isoform X2 n=1 Tax=Styela clava TaxID=7725 RepID=UPI001939A169|nr:uncharacterized protein LOC120328833 isoform X2 [Styela clava]
MEISRRNNNMIRASSESILQRKKIWLRDKIEEIRTSYNDTLCAFRDKLDGVVTEPVSNASNILDRPDNSLSLQDIASAGNLLQECNNKLFDLLLSICPENSNIGGNDGQQLRLLGIPTEMNDAPVILQPADAIHIMSTDHVNVDYMQLEAASVDANNNAPLVPRSSLKYSTESDSSVFERSPAPASHCNSNVLMPGRRAVSEKEIPSSDLDLTLSSILPCDPHSTPKKENIMVRKKSSSLTQTSSDISSDISALDHTPTRRTYYAYSSEERENNVFQGTVSDVVSPSRFSVQPKQNMRRIEKLQHDLNRFYEQRTKEISQLEFKSPPLPGEYCAVVYQPDNNWYRALVMEASTQPTIMVEYIDYGNMDIVPWTSALKLHPKFSQLPRQSICCCLADVKPLSPRDVTIDDTAYDSEWNLPAIDFFDKFVYNQTYELVTVENPSSSGRVSVKLFYVEITEGKPPMVKNVSNILVKEGFATFIENEKVPIEKLDQKCLEQIKRTNKNLNESSRNPEVYKSSADDNSTKAQSDGGLSTYSKKLDAGDASRRIHPCSSNRLSITPPILPKPKVNEASRSMSCIPAGMERTHHNYASRPKHAKTASKSSGYYERKPPPIPSSTKYSVGGQKSATSTSCSDSIRNTETKNDLHPVENEATLPEGPRFLTPTSSVSTMLSNNNQKATEEDKKMEEWNPMESDFNSLRNCYGVDDENACAVTEGFDPEKMNVCPYYVRGKCWNGDKCINSHPARYQNGELRNETQTFSASSLLKLELNEGVWCIVRITVSDRTDNFYVHVVKIVGNMKDCINLGRNISVLPEISPDLGTLMSDMKQYYSQSTRRLKDLIQPCKGEMYAVHVPEENCFYRGMILEVSYSTTSFTTARVFLVDFGREVMVLERYLHPMHSTFMHLPRQAVQCCLNEGEDYKGENLGSNGTRPHLAMQIHEKCEETDGPLITSLFRIDKDGLHRISQF